jgi:hypothetical protein
MSTETLPGIARKPQKLEKETLSILQNFSKFNYSILLNPGDKLTTVTPGRTVVAMATVPQKLDLEKPVAIDDLTKFVALVSKFKSPQFVIEGDCMVITEAASAVVRYPLTSPEKVGPFPAEKIRMPDVCIRFKLPGNVLAEILKAAKECGFVTVTADGEKLWVEASDCYPGSLSKSPALVMSLGASDQTLRITWRATNLKLMPGDYMVEVGYRVVNGKDHWLSRLVSGSVEYFAAVERFEAPPEIAKSIEKEIQDAQARTATEPLQTYETLARLNKLLPASISKKLGRNVGVSYADVFAHIMQRPENERLIAFVTMLERLSPEEVRTVLSEAAEASMARAA